MYAANSTSIPPEDYNIKLFPIDPEHTPNHNPMFCVRVKIGMIGTRVWNSLSQAAQLTLQPKLNKFLWTDPTSKAHLYDGVVMLQIIVESIFPATMVGISTLKDKICSVTLSGYNHNVVEMFNHQS